jgi:hypothetical protein
MSLGQCDASAGADGRNQRESSNGRKTPFNFGAVALAALLAAATFFLLAATYLLAFQMHRIGVQATISTLAKWLMTWLPLPASFYLAGFSLNRAVIRTFAGASPVHYALAGVITPSVLVFLGNLLLTGNGGYGVLVVMAPGGLVGGLLLGVLARRSAVAAA